ncbi:gamma-glutamyl-gamma-aminobutyrate hydrolase family protein [Halalkalibaculum sp. DA3122]|uniref:gamma-glutamyl-gamma-aminobutyrate hydrolase family protein n=1 Tax=Halalkalibaculum sp. DA3122 TaxID=3373607 RepID=UPI00375539F0
MKKTKPIIGVTSPDHGGTAGWLFTKLALWLQGAEAVRITTEQLYPAEQLDGLILGGGADVNPRYYGQRRESASGPGVSKKGGVWQYVIQAFSIFMYPFIFLVRKLFAADTRSIDKERDELELRYLNHALERGIPVLGICRGAQLININLGGTLYQDITGFYGEVPRVYSIFPKKSVEVDRESRLGKLLDEGTITVNAMHNQAIDKLAPPLRVVAREKTGIIQAVEQPDAPFLIGVQWHPEYMPHVAGQRNIFKALVDAARAASGKN